MYRTLSSINDHEYIPSQKGSHCENTNPRIKCNMLGCVRCQPSCKICGLYHPSINYMQEKKPLNFTFSRDNVFTNEYQHFLYHDFEPDTNPSQRGHPTESGKKFCYDSDCGLCRPVCKHCGKLKQNHSYK